MTSLATLGGDCPETGMCQMLVPLITKVRILNGLWLFTLLCGKAKVSFFDFLFVVSLIEYSGFSVINLVLKIKGFVHSKKPPAKTAILKTFILATSGKKKKKIPLRI